MKKTQYSALDNLESFISRMNPGASVTISEILSRIDPKYRTKQTISTAVMLLQKYGIQTKGV